MSTQEVFQNNSQGAITNAKELGTPKLITLGLQHAFTMFGATVLVPLITGLNISVALFMSGIGTLIFHLLTKGKVPAYLGSSFAYIAPILAVSAAGGLAYAGGGLVVAGIVYVLLALLIYLVGAERILRFFPPVVTGPIIIVIGLSLAPTAIEMASNDWLLAIVAFAVVTSVSVFTRGFARVIPVIIGLFTTYILAMVLHRVDYTPIIQAKVFGVPNFMMAKFSLTSIITVAPLALVTMVEHIGDVTAIGATVGKDYLKEPGLFRTLLGDGIATAISAMFGGPANTTYSENTGVLALTKVWDPLVMRIAAVFAIILGLIPKLGGVISSIPVAIIGGISIILFGMIASVGARTLVENRVDFTSSRNLIIAAAIMVLGLGGAKIPVIIGQASFTIEGMALAAIVGIILHVILPEEKRACNL